MHGIRYVAYDQIFFSIYVNKVFCVSKKKAQRERETAVDDDILSGISIIEGGCSDNKGR